jgi:CDP-diacylglycerol---glycerol-3-phosphate 3-phosphatidyltransferase
MATPMSWDGYVSAWSGAHDGFDPRHAGPGLRWCIRSSYRVGLVLSRRRVKVSTASRVAVLCALMVPALCAQGGGWPLLAAIMLVVGLAAQTLAGTLAVLRGQATRLRAFYGTLIDRFGELCWLVALAALGARVGLLLLCGGLVLLYEYMRARATSAGLRAAGSSTIGDRSVRVWLVGVGLMLAGIAGAQIGEDLGAGLITLVVISWLAVGVIGLGQLLTVVRKALA